MLRLLTTFSLLTFSNAESLHALTKKNNQPTSKPLIIKPNKTPVFKPQKGHVPKTDKPTGQIIDKPGHKNTKPTKVPKTDKPGYKYTKPTKVSKTDKPVHEYTKPTKVPKKDKPVNTKPAKPTKVPKTDKPVYEYAKPTKLPKFRTDKPICPLDSNSTEPTLEPTSGGSASDATSNPSVEPSAVSPACHCQVFNASATTYGLLPITACYSGNQYYTLSHSSDMSTNFLLSNPNFPNTSQHILDQSCALFYNNVYPLDTNGLLYDAFGSFYNLYFNPTNSMYSITNNCVNSTDVNLVNEFDGPSSYCQ